jgi:hypothetical protein
MSACHSRTACPREPYGSGMGVQYRRELRVVVGIEIITQGKETVPKRRFFTNVSVSVPQSKQDK